MAIDLSDVVRAEMLIERLNLADESTLSIESRNDDDDGWEVIEVLTSEMDWDLRYIENLAVSKPFLRIRIMEDATPTLPSSLKVAETFVFEGERYRLSKLDRPLGATRVYTLKADHMESA